MTSFERGRPALEGGWVLTGGSADGPPVKIVLGETELSQAYLGVVIGRHAGLCDRVIDDPGVSRRHLRIGLADGGLFAEDLNSLNGTLLDGEAIQPFQPERLDPGQVLILGQVVLTVSRLSNEAA